jgi:hypothetical protein
VPHSRPQRTAHRGDITDLNSCRILLPTTLIFCIILLKIYDILSFLIKSYNYLTEQIKAATLNAENKVREIVAAFADTQINKRKANRKMASIQEREQ